MQDEKRRVLTKVRKPTPKPNRRFPEKTHNFLSRFFIFTHQNDEKQGKKISRRYRFKILLYIHFQKAKTIFCLRKEKRRIIKKTMNLYDLQNNFWRIDEQKSFSGNDTRLYFYLLYLANRAYWQSDEIEFGDEKIKAILGVSSAVLRTSRSRLKEAGLINFQPGGVGFRVKTRYQILTSKLEPNSNPKLNSIYNKNNIKINTNIKNDENRSFSKREFIANGSDFD